MDGNRYMSSKIEIEITGFTYGGDGVGRLPDGKTAFVPYTIPGEKVAIEITGDKKKYARAKPVQIIEPSPNRIIPLCRHYGFCGGCHIQHISYSEQIRLKQSVVTEQVKKAGLNPGLVLPIQPSPQEWHYRNNLQFHLSPEGRLGFQAAHTNQVIPIYECHLPVPALDAIWQNLQMDPGVSIWRISARAGVDDEISINLEGEYDDLPEIELDIPCSIIHQSPAGELILAGNPSMPIRVGETDFQVSSGSFFQVNTGVAHLMAEYALNLVEAADINLLLDVYCGVGLFSRWFAPHVKKIIGVESSESACLDFAENLAEYDDVAIYQGNAQDILPYLDAKPDLVLVDPPRAGLDEKVLESIIRMSPKNIIYISCDPSTFTRDASRFIQKGYQMQSIKPFDMFPQTYHVEVVAIFNN
jgi:23S rRNA (uracil1939-C5)-methyltransferase